MPDAVEHRPLLCSDCRYDVTQTLSDGIEVCPECGGEISEERCRSGAREMRDLERIAVLTMFLSPWIVWTLSECWWIVGQQNTLSMPSWIVVIATLLGIVLFCFGPFIGAAIRARITDPERWGDKTVVDGITVWCWNVAAMIVLVVVFLISWQ